MPFDGVVPNKAVAKQTNLYAMMRAVFAFKPNETRRRSVPNRFQTVTSYDILQLADSLIDKPHNWVQRRYETSTGRRCAIGAIRAAYRTYCGYPGAVSALTDSKRILRHVILARYGFDGDIEKFNDTSSYRQVRQAFADAIAISG
jgi:hypothetical protein